MDVIPKAFQALLMLSILLVSSSAQSQDQFVFNGFHDQADSILLNGIAGILPNGLLQLTNTSKPRIGRAFHKLPLAFDPSLAPSLSFSTCFVFAIVPEAPRLGGHGIAFVLAPAKDFPGAFENQYFGLLNTTTMGRSSNRVLAVELDTADNSDLLDIDGNHVGVDVNSLISADSASAAYFSSKETRNVSLYLLSGRPMQVWIDYDGRERAINVTLAPASVPKPERPLLSASVNLSQIVMERMYVGFSSSTGSIASNHYILGWSFNRSGPAQSLEISKLPKLPKTKSRSPKQGTVIVVLAATAGFFLAVVVAGVAYTVRKRRYREIREDWEKIYGPQRLSYKSLYKATKGFRELVGEGGFGKVYRGTLPSTQAQIAVKKVSHRSDEGMEQFVAEIAAMGRLRHRNLVQLIGYCRRKGELLLAYEFMPHGSLDKYLFEGENPSLGWAQRLRILQDVASALLYLHEEWEQVVLHRDVKASNVLIDRDWTARLGDFGLARLTDHGADPQTTHVVGTVGYLAPELSRTGKATTSSDVYSFGVFMLEVACGRRPVKPAAAPDEIILVDWVFECSRRGTILDACDPNLAGDFVAEEMSLVLTLGLLCTCTVPAERPSMRQVVQFLGGEAASALPEIRPREHVTLNTILASWEGSDLAMSFPTSSLAQMGSPRASFASTDSIFDSGR